MAALCADTARALPHAKAVFASHCSSVPVWCWMHWASCPHHKVHLGEAPALWPASRCWDMALAVYDHCYSFAEGRHRAVRTMLTLVMRPGRPAEKRIRRVWYCSTLPRYYLATMQMWDAECTARVEKHRRMRA